MEVNNLMADSRHCDVTHRSTVIPHVYYFLESWKFYSISRRCQQRIVGLISSTSGTISFRTVMLVVVCVRKINLFYFDDMNQLIWVVLFINYVLLSYKKTQLPKLK